MLSVTLEADQRPRGHEPRPVVSDIHGVVRQGGLRWPKILKQHALHRFASLPRLVRILWFMAAFEALTIAMRAFAL